MLPGMEMLACPNLAVSPEVMHHIVQVESGANPFAIGVVNGRLVRQPRNMDEALATARMLESKGYNFSLGIAQVNRYNLGRYGLDTYRKAFSACENLAAGAQILASCYGSAHGDWGKAFSCYYSGNFTTGFRDGYVQKVYASINREAEGGRTPDRSAKRAIPVVTSTATRGRIPTSTDHAAMRPLVVYADDSAQYRVALRSVAIDTAATAMMPLVVSAAAHSPHVKAFVPMEAMARDTSDNATDQVTSTSAAAPGNSQPTSTGGVSGSTTPGTARATDDDVFKPRVSGPNDLQQRSAAVAQRASKPVTDGADLRLEQRDASFVF